MMIKYMNEISTMDIQSLLLHKFRKKMSVDLRFVDAQSKRNRSDDDLCSISHPTLMNSPLSGGGDTASQNTQQRILNEKGS